MARMPGAGLWGVAVLGVYRYALMTYPFVPKIFTSLTDAAPAAELSQDARMLPPNMRTSEITNSRLTFLRPPRGSATTRSSLVGAASGPSEDVAVPVVVVIGSSPEVLRHSAR
jgi:hypothetical protein